MVFHMSLLKKCVSDPIFIIPWESVGVKESLAYEEVLAEIPDWQVKKLRNEVVAFINVLWRNQKVESVTWEAKAKVIKCYPCLFSSVSA